MLSRAKTLSQVIGLAASDVSRHLAPSDGKSYVDYTVFKVVILTLGLVLAVELLCHRLDVSVKNRPFFYEVLEVFYRELATLGIVEFAIFLLHQYYKGLNLQQEYLFARVHFMLFYTVILNGIQSILIYFISSHVSSRMWVKTEQLELSHYVAIREEFEEVEQKLNMRSKASIHNGNDRLTADDEQRDRLAEETFNLRKWFKYWRKMLRYPRLMRRYEELLVQVRFHELRVHFIHANDLPLKFKVSDYLQKSELQVLVDLVHVSSFAWLTMMGMVNLVYFFMSVVAWINPYHLGRALKGILIGSCCLFIVASIVIIQKMKWIFAYIMHTKLIDTNAQSKAALNVGRKTRDSTPQRLEVSGSTTPKNADTVNTKGRNLESSWTTVKQLDLFWHRDPSLITGSIQLMQFGYSLFVAMLLIFWKDVDKAGFKVKGGVLAGVCAGSWLIFVCIMAQVIPRYTLCTNLGQLVNIKTMREILAQYRLEDMIRKRRKELEDSNAEEVLKILSKQFATDGGKSRIHGTEEPLKNLDQSDTAHGIQLRDRRYPVRKKGMESDSDSESGKLSKLADLVAKPTSDLPKLPPSQQARRRDQRKRRRRRALSDGVTAMRNSASMRNLSYSGTSELKPESNFLKKDASGEPEPSDTRGYVSDGEETDKGDVSSGMGEQRIVSQEVVISEGNATQRRKTRLKKSVSANVLLMRSPPSTLFATEDHGRLSYRSKEGSHDSKSRSPLDGTKKRLTSSISSEVLDSVLEDIPARSVVAPKTSAPEWLQSNTSTGCGSANTKANDNYSLATASAGTSALSILGGADEGKPMSGNIFNMENGAMKKSATAGTLDDGKSDVDDISIPDVCEIAGKTKKTILEHKTLMDRARTFLVTSQYRQISGVCGTMTCFFLVGIRMETLLIKSGVYQKNPSTMQIGGHVAFWMEFVWLIMFVLVSGFTLYAFFPRGIKEGKSSMCIAAYSDILLSTCCLGFLVTAEVSRTTGSFGSVERLRDGVGTIEPFTSIIALRVFRFAWGKRVHYWWSTLGSNSLMQMFSVSCHTDSASEASDGRRSTLLHSVSVQKVDTTSITKEKGTVVELWRLAMSMNPDLVADHGEFSSELFQAMLGIPTLKKGPMEGLMLDETKTPLTVIDDQPQCQQDLGEMTVKSNDESSSKKEIKRVHSSLQLAKRYAGLSPEVQAIIFAGRVGKPMKIVRDKPLNEFGDSTNDYGFFCMDDVVQGRRGEDGIGETKFMVDMEQHAKEVREDAEGELSMLVEPNAKLIRSMRRCERRLPPILDKWVVVDAVMTKYEIVLFDGADDSLIASKSSLPDVGGLTDAGNGEERPSSRLEGVGIRRKVREALVASKGGKKLRLRDVAAGRKIVGHVDLSTVDLIKVEHFVNTEGMNIAGHTEQQLSKISTLTEYWKDARKHSTTNVTQPCARNLSLSEGELRLEIQNRWEQVDEHRLKIHAVHQGSKNMLYLRFFSDLEDAETKAAGRMPANTENNKNDAFLWCQSIGRIRGKQQLVQDLPNFGDLGRDELNDYLETIHRTDGHHGHSTHSNWGRLMNAVNTRSHKRNVNLPETPLSDVAQYGTTRDAPNSFTAGNNTGATTTDSGETLTPLFSEATSGERGHSTGIIPDGARHRLTVTNEVASVNSNIATTVMIDEAIP